MSQRVTLNSLSSVLHFPSAGIIDRYTPPHSVCVYVCVLCCMHVCVGTNAEARGGHRVSSLFTLCLIPLRKVISLNLEHMAFSYAGTQDHPVIVSASTVLVLEVSVRLCMAWCVGAGF